MLFREHARSDRCNCECRYADASHLKGAVHHAHDVVELLVVQDGPVELHVQAELLGQTLSGRFALQGTQGRRESLDTTAAAIHSVPRTCNSSIVVQQGNDRGVTAHGDHGAWVEICAMPRP